MVFENVLKVIFLLTVVSKLALGYNVSCEDNRHNFIINDTAKVGDVIVLFDDPNFEIDDKEVFCPMRVANSSLILSDTLRSSNCNQTSFRCDMSCKGGASLSITFVVSRIDIHPPYFPAPFFQGGVKERVPTNEVVFQFDENGKRASDADCWANMRYQLQDTGKPFTVQPNGTVQTTGQIIYDEQQFYNLTVLAIFTMPNDASSSTASTVLEITVIDIDDKPPLFDDLRHTLQIDEETISTDHLETQPPVLCRDQDFGINDTILYDILDKTYFDIVNDTGKLIQRDSFDRETMPTWETEITCFQEDDPAKSDKAILQVIIGDVNDHLPEFTKTSMNVSLVENSVQGTYVTTVTATDKDLGNNSVVIYRLEQLSDTFEIDNITGVITVLNEIRLDRELVSNLSFLAYAVDIQGNRSENNVSIEVSILDVNDNAPSFTEDVYRFYFNTSNVTSEIGKVSAVDDDVPGTPNSNITYSILLVWQESTNGLLPLQLDIITGVISINGSVLPNSSYSLIIQACDNPVIIEERRCSISRVIAAYTLNTTFSSLSVTMEIVENSAIGTVIGKIPIRGDHYTTSTYRFIVDPTSHMLKTNTSLDRETKEDYSVMVDVYSDTLGPIGTVNATINILDMNDNPPIFDRADYFFSLPHTNMGDQVVGTVTATDDDVGNNSAKLYHIQGSSSSEVYHLDSVSGVLKLKDWWWLSKSSFYQLTVTVSDYGVPSLQTSTMVYISEMTADNYTSSVRVGTTAEASAILTNKTHFEREIATALNMGIVRISSVEINQDQNKLVRSFINFTGIGVNETDVPIYVLEMQRLVVDNWTPLQEIFRAEVQYIYASNTSSDGLKTTEIALIVIAAVILIGGVVAIIVVYRLWDKHSRNQRLYESLGRPSTLYDSQEIRMEFGDEHGPTNLNKGKTNKEIEEYEGSFGLGYVNTGYLSDDDAPKTPTWNANDTPRIPRWSTSDSLKDAIESLEELTNRLNSEDNISRITSMSKERKSLRSYKSSNDGTPLVDDIQDKYKEMKDYDDYITPIVDYPIDDVDTSDKSIENRDTDQNADECVKEKAGVYYVNSFRKQCKDVEETEEKTVILEATAF